ncbi:alpha/beta hydrolase [Aestuariibacter halophilus]|uniref:Alpha/beta hydrolase n=1 Tax=Fluctibacter halophilus TaxID=226011 RepID=A0ABS8GDD7_9ALTE|nr:alpha/beta fold hydrolase [Aestuariibacter halophilus]MCC2618126.1 alpha/beta hydrolase [Aestuariibacter halophilus]
MNAVIAYCYQVYFSLFGRIAPQRAAAKALALMFTVRRRGFPFIKVPQPDQITTLPSHGYLLRWAGNNGKSILLLHGWNGTLDQFERLFHCARAEGYTVYGLQPRGYGPSSYSQSNPGWFIRAIEEAIHTVPGLFDIAVGHSMGAGALAYSASKDAIAKQLVLISGPASFENIVTRFAALLKLGNQATRCFSAQVQDIVGLRHEQLDIESLASNISVPVTLLHDEDDPQIPIADARALEQALPNATLIVSRGFGHVRLLNSDATTDAFASLMSDQSS